MEMVRDALSVIGALCLLCTALLAAWIAIAGQRQAAAGGPIPREERERRWRERVDRYWGDA